MWTPTSQELPIARAGCLACWCFRRGARADRRPTLYLSRTFTAATSRRGQERGAAAMGASRALSSGAFGTARRDRARRSDAHIVGRCGAERIASISGHLMRSRAAGWEHAGTLAVADPGRSGHRATCRSSCARQFVRPAAHHAGVASQGPVRTITRAESRSGRIGRGARLARLTRTPSERVYLFAGLRR